MKATFGPSRARIISPSGFAERWRRIPAQTIRQHLDRFVTEEGISTTNARFYSHVLPSPEIETIRHRPVAGRNWALAGDAAACTDPATGEGLYYALRSGDLLAQSLIQELPETYPLHLRAELSAELEFAARVARLLFRGQFLGARRFHPHGAIPAAQRHLSRIDA